MTPPRTVASQTSATDSNRQPTKEDLERDQERRDVLCELLRETQAEIDSFWKEGDVKFKEARDNSDNEGMLESYDISGASQIQITSLQSKLAEYQREYRSLQRNVRLRIPTQTYSTQG